jgi:Kef-type K+ transport system membrane component KefB
MWLVVRPLLRVLAARIGVQSFACLSGVVAAGILLSASVTEAIGIHPIFGAFAFGMVMPREPGGVLDEHMAAPFRGASAILLPVYFIVVGLSVDIAGLRGTDYAVLALVVTVACVGKVAGSALPARWCGSSWRESTAIGILMNTRGLTELIVLNLGVTLGILDTRLFTILVLMALITTSMTGPLIDRLLHGCIRRQVADSVARAEQTGLPELVGPR